MTRIHDLQAESYRGASVPMKIEFSPNARLTLVFGENGTGKSTVVDGLDAVGNETLGSLTTRSSTSGRHIATIGHPTTATSIRASGPNGIWTATLVRNAITVSPTPRPQVRVLRRATIERIISRPPGERYDELRKVVDVAAVERSEETLKAAAAAAKNDLDRAAGRLTDASNSLETLWDSEGRPGSSATVWALEVSAADVDALAEFAQRLRSAATEARSAAATADSLARAESGLTPLSEALDAAQTELERIELEVPEELTARTVLLRTASQHLRSHPGSGSCPVCEQSVSPGDLRQLVDDRLRVLSDYSTAVTARDDAAAAYQRGGGQVQAYQQQLVQQANSLYTLLDQNPEVAAVFGTALLGFSALRGEDPQDRMLAGVQLVAECAAIVETVERRATESEIQVGRVNPVKMLRGAWDEADGAARQAERLSTALAKAYEEARLARIRFVQAALDELMAECNQLYASIHPGEAVAMSRLSLDEARRESLHQESSFEGHTGVPPQAYFSESHLDTLGFCLWLAAAKLEPGAANTILVLDDVFTSVDAQHISAIAKLLVDESQHFGQVIVATHQRRWRDIYVNPYGPGNLVEVLELQHWSMERGIRVFKTPLEARALAEGIRAEPFDRQATASKAGVLLESVLDSLAVQFRCRLPRTGDPAYTLNELLDGTSSLFKNMELDREDEGGGRKTNRPKPTFDKLRETAMVRNQVGAHYNLTGVEISNAEVQEFAELAIALVEEITCTTCGQIPSRPSGTHHQCGCSGTSQTRLAPLALR